VHLRKSSARGDALNISIRHIQHFIAVAEELHFRRAAQLTNVAQPALSRSVQTLESELGVQLLTRNNRNVKLTLAGKEFLAGCTDIVDAMESTINRSIRADQTQFGGLNMGYTYIAMCGNLPQLVSAFEDQNPTVKIEPIAGSSANQLEQLHHETLDCGFLSGAFNATLLTDLESVVFQEDAFNVIVNNHHPLANRGTISIEELVKEKVMLSGLPRDSTFNQHVHQFLHAAGAVANIEYVDQNHVGLLGLVTLGRGVCIATEGYGCVFSDELKALKLTGTDAKLPTLMVWRKDIHSESALRFRDYVLRRLPAQSVQSATEDTRLYETEPG